MVTIILLRSAMSALSILTAVKDGSIAGIIIYSLLAILGFWFTATCLAVIGDTAGDKQVTGIIVVGLHPFSSSAASRSDAGFYSSLSFCPILMIISTRNAGISIFFSAAA